MGGFKGLAAGATATPPGGGAIVDDGNDAAAAEEGIMPAAPAEVKILSGNLANESSTDVIAVVAAPQTVVTSTVTNPSFNADLDPSDAFNSSIAALSAATATNPRLAQPAVESAAESGAESEEEDATDPAPAADNPFEGPAADPAPAAGLNPFGGSAGPAADAAPADAAKEKDENDAAAVLAAAAAKKKAEDDAAAAAAKKKVDDDAAAAAATAVAAAAAAAAKKAEDDAAAAVAAAAAKKKADEDAAATAAAATVAAAAAAAKAAAEAEGTRWVFGTATPNKYTLTEGGAVARHLQDENHQAAIADGGGNRPMTFGRHYWELEVVSNNGGDGEWAFGVCRPGTSCGPFDDITLSQSLIIHSNDDSGSGSFFLDTSNQGHNGGGSEPPNKAIPDGSKVGLLMDYSNGGTLSVCFNRQLYGTIARGLSGELYPCISVRQGHKVVRIHGGLTPP